MPAPSRALSHQATIQAAGSHAKCEHGRAACVADRLRMAHGGNAEPRGSSQARTPASRQRPGSGTAGGGRAGAAPEAVRGQDDKLVVLADRGLDHVRARHDGVAGELDAVGKALVPPLLPGARRARPVRRRAGAQHWLPLDPLPPLQPPLRSHATAAPLGAQQPGGTALFMDPPSHAARA